MLGFSAQGKVLGFEDARVECSGQGLGVTVAQKAQRRAERLKWLGGRSAQAAAADEGE